MIWQENNLRVAKQEHFLLWNEKSNQKCSIACVEHWTVAPDTHHAISIAAWVLERQSMERVNLS
jgi:hypothetical protein